MSTRNLAFLILALAVAVGLYSYYGRSLTAPKTENPTATSTPQVNTYRNETYGIAFTYPTTYALEEAERGNGERAHYAIVLTKKTDLPPPANGEGPTGISIDIYQNNLDTQTLIGWLTGNSASNFKLSPDGTYTTASVDGREAIAYRWSGLYEADNTAFLHKDNIVSIAATYITPDDDSLRVYRGLLNSMELY